MGSEGNVDLAVLEQQAGALQVMGLIEADNPVHAVRCGTYYLPGDFSPIDYDPMQHVNRHEIVLWSKAKVNLSNGEDLIRSRVDDRGAQYPDGRVNVIGALPVDAEIANRRCMARRATNRRQA